jgi:hypothetical protein
MVYPSLKTESGRQKLLKGAKSTAVKDAVPLEDTSISVYV